MAGILDGIRIIDLTTGLAGPLAVRLLAEAGADVVKVEPPTGDLARRHAPAGFASWNRSKRSVVLDLRSDDGRDHLEGLLAGADVVVHGFPPSRATALGLDDTALAERHPHLIAATLTGYPVGHPDEERPGWDVLVQARTGLMDEQMGHRDGPIFLRLSPASWGAVHLLASGILARLIMRERTGAIGPVHTSLLQGGLAPVAQFWHRLEHPNEVLRVGSLNKDASIKLRPLRCSDGEWVEIVGNRGIPAVLEVVRAAGEPEDDEAAWARAMETKTADEWVEIFAAADVPCTKVARLGDGFTNPQSVLNQYVVDVDDPVFGPTTQAASPYRTVPPVAVTSPAPTLGQHTNEVLAERRPTPTLPKGRHPVGRGPLAGLRVVDFGMFLAGPFAPQCLADLGADVIKVEPTTGDKMRQASQFLGCQRNKRDLALDLRDPASRVVLERVVRWADVVHHNIRQPAQPRLGIDEPSLRAVNPDVVVCHTGTFGTMGPKADWPGYDPTAQAESGWMWENGGEGNPPLWFRFGLMDHQCAFSSLVATLLAVLHRERTGEASFVAASLLGAAVLTSSETLLCRAEDGTSAPAPVAKLDHDQTGVSPGYGIHRCADGWVAAVAVDAGALEALEERRALLGGWTAAQAQAELEAAGVPAEVVRTAQRDPFFDDPANVAAGLVHHGQHAQWGQCLHVGSYWEFGDTETLLDRDAPALGEHTVEVLGELGFDDDEVATFLRDGIVVAFDPESAAAAGAAPA